MSRRKPLSIEPYAPLFPFLAASSQSLILAPGELIVDNFAGGGGASTGLEQALGRPVDIAINHDPEALAMHAANHPYTDHHCESVWDVDPREVTAGRRVALAWFSPDCKHFSKAKGGKPKSKNIRGLAWVALRWAATVRPRVICIENVEEMRGWGPLDAEGQPIKAQIGRTFQSWINAFRKQGYAVEYRELRACNYGAPTSRKRLFVIARCDGLPIVWPEPTHGDPKSLRVASGELLAWRTAAECIDWSRPCPSLFERRKPLVVSTNKRISQGLLRYTLKAHQPYIVTCNHKGDGFRGQGLDEPMKTLTAAHDAHGLVSAQIVRHNHGEKPADSVEEPARTVTTQHNHLNLLTASLAPRYGEREGQTPRAQPVDVPLPTVTTGGNGSRLAVATLIKTDNQKSRSSCVYPVDGPLFTLPTKNNAGLVTACLVRQNGGHCKPHNAPYPITVPMKTITANGKPHDIVTAQLVAYYSSSGKGDMGQALHKSLRTVRTTDCFALTTAYVVRQQRNDIGHAMNTPMKTVMPGGGGGKSQLVTVQANCGLTEAQFDRAQQVYAFLQEHLGAALDTHADHAQQLVLVRIDGEVYVITDIGMRMLTPRELYRAQGFPEAYRIDFSRKGKPLPGKVQVRMCGNAVPPPFSRAIAHANLSVARQEAAD